MLVTGILKFEEEKIGTMSVFITIKEFFSRDPGFPSSPRTLNFVFFLYRNVITFSAKEAQKYYALNILKEKLNYPLYNFFSSFSTNIMRANI